MLKQGLDITEELTEYWYDEPAHFDIPFYEYFLSREKGLDRFDEKILIKMFEVRDVKLDLYKILSYLKRLESILPDIIDGLIYHISKYKDDPSEIEDILGKNVFELIFKTFSDVYKYEKELIKLCKALIKKGFRPNKVTWEIIFNNFWDDESFAKIMNLMQEYDVSFPDDFIPLLLDHDLGKNYLAYALTHGGKVPDNISEYSEDVKLIFAEKSSANVLNSVPREIANIILGYIANS